jgi:signal recognition particle receptor subunit beta
MVQINFAQKQVNAKIVYYGPGMSGKTTNLEVVHQRAPQSNRGELTSISTDGDRTLFFDFMPLDLGTVAGMRTSFQIYTVPGQVYYNSTRKLVLQGVDGVVFVADSSASMIEENLESMRNLEENLNEYGKSLSSLPLVIQFNKRDLPDAMTVDELNAQLNPYGAPCFEAIASSGQGVFPTLKALAARVLDSIHSGSDAGSSAPQHPTPTTGTGFHAPTARPQAPAAQQRPAAPAFQAPPSLQQTGFQQGAFQQGGFNQQPAIQQTGFQQRPAAAAMHQPQPLGQTGFHQAQGGPRPVDPLARTSIQPPPMGHPNYAGQQDHGGYAQPAPQAGPVGSPQLRMAGGGGAPTGVQQRAPAPPAQQNVMRVDKSQAASKSAPAKRSIPVARQDAPRLQPRSAPSPTPVRKSKKKVVMYGSIFVIFALGIGAVLGRFLLSWF